MLVLRRHLVVSGRTAGRSGLPMLSFRDLFFKNLEVYDFSTCFSLFLSEAWTSNGNKILVCDRHLLSADQA